MGGKPGDQKAAADTDRTVKRRPEDRMGEKVSSVEDKLTLGGQQCSGFQQVHGNTRY